MYFNREHHRLKFNVVLSKSIPSGCSLQYLFEGLKSVSALLHRGARLNHLVRDQNAPAVFTHEKFLILTELKNLLRRYTVKTSTARIAPYRYHSLPVLRILDP